MYLHDNTDDHDVVVARRRVVGFNLSRCYRPLPPAAPAIVNLSISRIICVTVVVVDSAHDGQFRRKGTLSTKFRHGHT